MLSKALPNPSKHKVLSGTLKHLKRKTTHSKSKTSQLLHQPPSLHHVSHKLMILFLRLIGNPWTPTKKSHSMSEKGMWLSGSSLRFLRWLDDGRWWGPGPDDRWWLMGFCATISHQKDWGAGWGSWEVVVVRIRKMMRWRCWTRAKKKTVKNYSTNTTANWGAAGID